MDALTIHAKAIAGCRPLTREAERRLFARWRKHGDREAYELLVESQLKWVWRVAVKFAGKGIPLEDLVQAGHVGLLHAIEKWRPAKKTRLGTYATWWIRQHMQTLREVTVGIVRLPRNPETYGRERYDALYTRFVAEMRSLDFEAEGPAGGTPRPLRDTVAATAGRPCEVVDPRTVEADDDLAEREWFDDRRRALWRAVDQLDARQRTIVERRMEGATLEEVSRELAVTRERVRQIERKAVERLVYLCTGRGDGPMPSLSEVAKVRRRPRKRGRRKKVAAEQSALALRP